MAKINWFPGHMAKSLNQMTDEIKNVDMLIYVLDARAPFSCLNPKFDAISLGKPVLYVLNKTDLADEQKTKIVYQKLSSMQSSKCIMLSSIISGANSKIEPLMKELCTQKFEKYKAKGLNAFLRAMVVGVPNSGKSTLVNNLCGQKKAITGDRAGVTRGKQWVKLKNGFELLDTPGTLWPNLEDQKVATNLALIGSIKNEILDTNELCLSLVEILSKLYPQSLKNRYNIEIDKTPLQTLMNIANAKKFMLKGDIDFERTCTFILEEFKKGKLGNITLDEVV